VPDAVGEDRRAKALWQSNLALVGWAGGVRQARRCCLALENGLGRPDGGSRPTPGRLASQVGIDAFTGTLRRGILGSISVTTETEIPWQYQGGVWLMTQSSANPSPGQIPC